MPEFFNLIDINPSAGLGYTSSDEEISKASISETGLQVQQSFRILSAEAMDPLKSLMRNFFIAFS